MRQGDFCDLTSLDPSIGIIYSWIVAIKCVSRAWLDSSCPGAEISCQESHPRWVGFGNKMHISKIWVRSMPVKWIPFLVPGVVNKRMSTLEQMFVCSGGGNSDFNLLAQLISAAHLPGSKANGIWAHSVLQHLGNHCWALSNPPLCPRTATFNLKCFHFMGCLVFLGFFSQYYRRLYVMTSTK